MAARRCSLCGINYPNTYQFQKCPVHTDETTSFFSDLTVDENWEWAATALMARAKEAATEHAGIAIIPLEPRPIIGNLYGLDSRDVIRVGARLTVGAFFEIPSVPGQRDAPCNCFWEVLGYHDGDRLWIVEPIRVPDYVPAP